MYLSKVGGETSTLFRQILMSNSDYCLHLFCRWISRALDAFVSGLDIEATGVAQEVFGFCLDHISNKRVPVNVKAAVFDKVTTNPFRWPQYRHELYDSVFACCMTIPYLLYVCDKRVRNGFGLVTGVYRKFCTPARQSSGLRNHVKLIQGAPCLPSLDRGCFGDNQDYKLRKGKPTTRFCAPTFYSPLIQNTSVPP